MVEMKRWADFLNIPINLQPASFPVDETLAARTIIAVQDEGKDPAGLIETLMGDIWLRGRNIAEPQVVREALTGNGLSGEYLEHADYPSVANIYDANCEAAKADNIFGVPTYFANGEMFWGQDRLDFLDRALAR